MGDREVLDQRVNGRVLHLIVSHCICAQMCERRDELKAQVQGKKGEIERQMSTIERLRKELEQCRSASEKVNKLQAQQSLEIEKLKIRSEQANKLQAEQGLEIEKLKAALAEERANVENEREAKQDAYKER